MYRLRAIILTSCFIICFHIYGLAEPHITIKNDTTIVHDNVMTIDYCITIGRVLSDKEQIPLKQIIQATFQEVNDIYNPWNENSEISLLNKTKKHIKTKISPQLKSLLLLCDHLVTLTQGHFDPTINALRLLWYAKLNNNTIPTKQEIERCQQTTGWHNIHIEDDIFSKDTDETSIDLCAIAKGLCVDLLAERLNEAGFNNIIVDWGGEIRATGKHPSGRSWYVGIRDPLQNNSLITGVDLINQAIATSGDYFQQWPITMENDTTTIFSHIIDPTMGKALSQQPITSVTVLNKSCALADALATAIMTFQSQDDAKKWLAEMLNNDDETKVWIIFKDPQR